MTRDQELGILRRVYAKQIVHAARASDPRLEQALAELHREDFLSPGPWQLMCFDGAYQWTPSDDPIYLYQDTPVAILPGKGLNNGKPSFVTFLVSIGQLREGEHAVHVGIGTGYYTAVMSRLAGAAGKVIGIEYESKLASRAEVNLSPFSNVRVLQGDGSTMHLEPADVIYVNAGASRPADTWLDALKPDGGRMVLPLTVSFTTVVGHHMTRGAIFLIERQGQEYSARCMSSTVIYPCAGARDKASEKALIAAFKKEDIGKVTKLHRSGDISEERCWLRAPSWSLTYG